jgi:hypothetical protein
MARKTHLERLASAYQAAIKDSHVISQQATEEDWSATRQNASIEAFQKELNIGRQFLVAWKQATATKLPKALP